MTTMDTLTSGAISRLFTMKSSEEDPSFEPTLQIINLKPVNANGNQERYRVVLSDGVKYMQGLLATQANHLVHAKKLEQDCIIRLQKFVKNFVSGRTLVVVLNCEPVGSNPRQRLGSPEDIATTGAAAPAGNNNENVHPQQAQGMYGTTNNNNNRPHVIKPDGGGSSGGGNNTYGRNSNNNNNNNGFGGGGSRNPYVSSSSSSSSNAPIVRTTPNGSNFTPISNLNMYQSRWTIRARVTTKSDIRTWSNARGEGSLFSVELLDESGTDIRATMFKEAVDKFYSQLEEGKVYRFSGGRIKVANMQYNTCKSNFEITFDQNSEIHLDNDGGNIQQNVYDFVPNISHLENVEQNKFVDLLAIVKEIGDPTTLMSKKSGQELTKCELTLVDDSGTEIKLTLWGPDRANAAQQTYAGNPVVAFRRCKVSDFGGKSLSLSGSSEVNPVDYPDQVRRLQDWWNNGGSSGTGVKSLSASMGGGSVAPFHERLDIAAIKGKHMGHGDKPDWLTFKGTICFIKKDKEGGAWYPACPNKGDPCKNLFKVNPQADGTWYCDKCSNIWPNPVRRWIFSATIEDDTCSTAWVSFFDEQAKQLLGGAMTADEAYSQFMEHNQDQDGYDSLFHKALYTEWIFKCKVKTEQVNEEQRVKTSVYALQPVDYVKESEDMMAALAKWA